MTYTLSPSKLNLMEECPRCFWLSLVKKIDRPRGPMSSIPIKMDSILKKYFEKYRIKGQIPPLLEGKITGKFPAGIPKTLYAEHNGVKIKGLPDEYLETEEGYIVPFDHKTKSKPVEEAHPSYQLQMDVYTYLLKMNGYKTVNKAFLAFYYPCDCDVHKGLDIQCQILDVKTNPERIKALLEKANKLLNEDIPKASEKCEYCKWREAEI